MTQEPSAPPARPPAGVPAAGAPIVDLGASLTLVVPMYNEAHRLGANIDALVAFVESLPPGSELLFVDDGSTDGSADRLSVRLAELASNRARVIRRPHRGKGAAVRAGLAEATATLAGFCDIDLATPLHSLLEVARAAALAPVLAIGSRDIVGSTLLQRESALREFLGRSYNRVVQLLLTPGIIDTQCGAKVARTAIWRPVLAESVEDGFAWDVEAIALARALDIAVFEVAIEWTHDAGSGVHVARDGIRMLAALPRIRRRTRGVANARPAPVAVAGVWIERSKTALIASALRRAGARSGVLVDLDARSGVIAGGLGWEARRIVACCDAVPPVRALPLAFVVTRADTTPLPAGIATAVVLTRAPTVFEITEAARLVAPDGVLVVLAEGADPSPALRRAGWTVETVSHVFAWRRDLDRAPHPGSAARARAALVATAVERIAICRLGIRIPVGGAVLVVARPQASR